MTEEQVVLGDLRLSTKDIDVPGIRYDRIAVDSANRVQLIGAVAEANKLRAMRALISMSKSGGLRIEGAKGRVKKASDNDYYLRSPGWMVPAGTGYTTSMNKLEYGLLHVMFISKEPGFMLVADQESLWRELRDTRFTTPIMREWMPYVERKLREMHQLEELRCFRCNCALLKCQTKHLDMIVTKGIQDGEIAVPRPNDRPEA
jgi:hypothetical protein